MDGVVLTLPARQAYPKPRPPLSRQTFEIPSLRQGYTAKERNAFVASDKCSDRVRTLINEPYGKETKLSPPVEVGILVYTGLGKTTLYFYPGSHFLHPLGGTG